MVHLAPVSPLGIRRVFLTILAVCMTLWAHAQPKPCGPRPDMTTTCLPACVICDIDGYTGINDDTEKGQAPPGFCTGTVHHMQWIAFIAGSKDLTITVTPSGCKLGAGLEVGIYESSDCNTFKLVSNCNGGIPPGVAGVFSNTQPLVVGQYYYFVMDGNNNDVCNYTIRVTSGSTKVPPLAATGAIAGPAAVCQADSVRYSVPPVAGATFYQWQLDGNVVAEGREANIAFPDAGVHQLCVTAFNVCDTSDAACMTIQVWENKITRLTETLCEKACLNIADTLICAPGNYVFRRQTREGCDSVVHLTVVPIATVSVSFRTAICTTDSILVGDSWYRAPGSYLEVQPSASGCDSLIYLTLQGIVCEIKGTARGQPVLCHGGSSGALRFTVLDGTPPFIYTWERLGGNPSGSGGLASLNEETRIEGLPVGLYVVTVRDTFGNDAVFTAQVAEPPPLALSFDPSDYNGFNIACRGGGNGSLRAKPEGGTAPYRFRWNSGSLLEKVEGLLAGVYAVTVTDAAGCTHAGQAELKEPSALRFEALFSHPNCDGPYTGSIAAQNVRGGVGGYRFSLSGGNVQESPVFGNLGEGRYVLQVKDANGCPADTSGVLRGVDIPELDLGGDYELRLGYALRLQAFLNISPQTIRWDPPEGLSCADCLQPVANPVKTTVYTLTVTSADGCPDSDSLRVAVVKLRNAFVPNTFSPNEDGVNDFFTVFGGPALRQVKHLKVFSRWGELVFERSGFPANDATFGWDGRFRGQELDEGVFVWWAELEYVDGVSDILKGEVTIVK